MKTNLTNWLCGLSAVLLLAVLGVQLKQQGRLDALQHQQGSLSSGLGRQQQEQRDALVKLSDSVLTLSTNWESTLTPRLNAKSDEIVAHFSTRLNEKAAEAATQVASVIRLQAETALKASTVERANKTARLLEAASRYEKESRPELAELCYLSAFKNSDGHPGPVLKQFLAWQERNFAAMTENDVLTASPAKLMALYEALDKALPDSTALPDAMELALSTAEKIREQITGRQQKKMAELRGNLSWDQFDAANRSAYEQSKETLTSFSPLNRPLEKEKNDLLQTADNLIQTAAAMSPVSVADLLPPTPKAPIQILTNWFDRSLTLIAIPTNTVEARLAGLSVLMDFARQQSEQPECNRYAQILTNESVKLACAQWAGRVVEYGALADKKDKPDADTIALGQSLLNQGFAMLKSFTNKSLTGEVATALPGLASKLSLQRELLLVGQMRLAGAPNAFSSKEQVARARSLLYGQTLSAIFDLRALQSEVTKECGATPARLATLNDIEGRFREYLAAYEKLDKADMVDAQADQLSKQRQQYRRYADHCRIKINYAESNYYQAEDRASGLRTYTDEEEKIAKWSNKKPQQLLRDGLETLYSMDLNDLSRADPGLANLWQTTEEKLKKNLTNKNEAAPGINAATKKKSLLDF